MNLMRTVCRVPRDEGIPTNRPERTLHIHEGAVGDFPTVGARDIALWVTKEHNFQLSCPYNNYAHADTKKHGSSLQGILPAPSPATASHTIRHHDK